MSDSARQFRFAAALVGFAIRSSPARARLATISRRPAPAARARAGRRSRRAGRQVARRGAGVVRGAEPRPLAAAPPQQRRVPQHDQRSVRERAGGGRAGSRGDERLPFRARVARLSQQRRLPHGAVARRAEVPRRRRADRRDGGQRQQLRDLRERHAGRHLRDRASSIRSASRSTAGRSPPTTRPATGPSTTRRSPAATTSRRASSGSSSRCCSRSSSSTGSSSVRRPRATTPSPRNTRSRRASRSSTCRACRTRRCSRPPTRASWRRRRRSRRKRGACWPIPRAGASSITSSSGSTSTRCPTWCATGRSTRTSTRRCRRCCRARRARSSPISSTSPTGTFDALFTAPYTFANAALAKHYGLTGPTGSTYERVDAPGRAGVLTQGMMLAHDKATRTSIVRRGLKIRTDVLCQIVPAPPPDVDLSSLDKTATSVSQRERLEQHRTQASCAGCHNLMDPIGVVFEGFDAVGRARTVDEMGLPVVLVERAVGDAATPTVRSRTRRSSGRSWRRATRSAAATSPTTSASSTGVKSSRRTRARWRACSSTSRAPTTTSPSCWSRSTRTDAFLYRGVTP